MSNIAKPTRRATQLTLFQPNRPRPSWEMVPMECRSQIEQLLARMLREHAQRQLQAEPAREGRDE